MSQKYKPSKVEKKWQKFWQDKKIFEAKDFDQTRQKFFHLVMFPYPSGDLHIGHWFNFAPADTYARFKLMQGYNVLSPIGFDAFGLPAENAAIKRNLHPRDWTLKNISKMRKQLHSMGPMYDWSREIITCEPSYYKWTQWMFLQMYHKGLAYRKKQAANWCPSCQTVLANEQVVSGVCERCGSVTEIRKIEQWLFEITKYADRLLKDLEKIDWPEKTKTMQRNWIGRSEGAMIKFEIRNSKFEKNNENKIEVFTTRVDTLFGVTYLVLAPEHPQIKKITTKEHRATVEAYIDRARHKTERQRKEGVTDKTGVFTGGYATNPANNKMIPIWVADYVLMGYGTGAIMAVPAHDQRDFEFAKKFNLPIVEVISSMQENSRRETENFKSQTLKINQSSNEKKMVVFEGEGCLINSGQFNGLRSQEAREKMTKWLLSNGFARKTVQYKLRDWNISRQRYWGAPIPILYCDHCGTIPVPDNQLPVKLPPIKDYLPKGKPPLAAATEWVNTKCPNCNGPARRETETMDTFVDSSWYFLRYPDPHNIKHFSDRKAVNYWGPVDIYVGGAEHTVLHLLYARFFTKVLYDIGYIDFDEPFLRLRHQGLILGPDHHKMSKSRGNIIDPDSLLKEIGSDCIRMYLMFMAPYGQGGSWNPEGIRGIRRFIERVYRLANKLVKSPSRKIVKNQAVIRTLHRTINLVTSDLEELKFNTAIAHLMELLNVFEKYWPSKEEFKTYVQILAPFAPHFAEEIWNIMGLEPSSIFESRWPNMHKQYLREDSVVVAVAINGKTKGTISIKSGANQKEVVAAVNSDDRLHKFIETKKIVRIIYVSSKIINFVIE